MYICSVLLSIVGGKTRLIDKHMISMLIPIRRFRTPVRSVNAPAAYYGEVQRERRNRLFHYIGIKINNCIFAMYYILKGGETCQLLTGIFLCLQPSYNTAVSYPRVEV